MAEWTHQIGNVRLVKRDGQHRDYGDSWQAMTNTKLRDRIQDGLALAPLMVRCALSRLKTYQSFMVGTDGEEGVSSDALADIGDGLHKYFEMEAVIESGHSLQSFLRGLVTVYTAVAEGLKAPHDVIFYPERPGETAKAKTQLDGVVRPGSQSASFARAAFGFVDEFGHADWQGFTGGILMSQEYFAKSIPPSSWEPGEEIARVLVHEGTHRWAQTKDINYKHNSAAWRLDAEEKKIASDAACEASFGAFAWKRMSPKDKDTKLAYQRKTFVDPARNVAHQNIVRDRGANAKPLMSLNVRGLVDASRHRDGTAIDPLRWIENADSYSWFARRMWKQSGKPRQ